MLPRRVAMSAVFVAVAALFIVMLTREPQRVAGAATESETAARAADAVAKAPAAVSPGAQSTLLIDQLMNSNAPTRMRPVPPATASPPLPRWDAPLAEVLPALRARADAGDVPAACHLALALTACAFTRARQARPALLRVTRPDDKDAIDDIARSSVDYLRNGREQTCVGVDEAEFEARFHYLRQAAEGGSEAAMLAFVEGMPLLSFDAMVRHVDWIEQYRQEAPRYVAELLRRGSRRAALMFAIEGNGFQATLLAQLLQLDARSAATLHQLGQRVRGDPYSLHHPNLSAGQLEIGRGRAEAIFVRHFEARHASAKELRNASDLLDVEACAEVP